MARKSGAIIKSRNRKPYVDNSELQDSVKCKDCGCVMTNMIEDEDYYKFNNTYIYSCRECGREFLANQININYRYS